MLKKLDLQKFLIIRWIFFISISFFMPKIFSLIFYIPNSTNLFYYFNDLDIFFKLLFIWGTFTVCSIGLGNFLVNKSFSNSEKILIIISLPLINFFALASSQILKGVDIMFFTDAKSYKDIILFLFFYHIAIYIMLYLNYKTDKLNIEPKIIKFNIFLKRQHIIFKNFFWLRKVL
ncbi:hypothetical protein [Acinetobacter sp. BHS4]|uniref:hypothetical protein n=1 Tax=Acinetobacter sp. BHS4 TaxID=2836181 RepID=UPI001BCDA6B3|nr:hypothetical protein [Acinetobacter sp. BHS4]QVR69597.1 hypothetical protein KIP84_08560 [Acinetobacter sp. BHS4]